MHQIAKKARSSASFVRHRYSMALRNRSAAFRSLISVFMLLALATPSPAQEKTPVSVHRTCIADGKGEKLYLRYWFPDVNDSIPEPVCVFKTPELGGVPFRSANITYDSGRAAANIVVEFDEAARPLIEKMTARNLGNVVAIVVGDRIASMPMIWKAYSDNKLLIVVRNKNEAARILNVLNSGAAEGK